MAIEMREPSLPWTNTNTTAASALDEASTQALVDGPTPRSNEMREDLRLFAGRNAQVFLDVYDAGRAGWKGHRCWAGFFFPQVWFLYRKLYGMAAFSIFWPIAWAFVHVPSSWNTGIALVPAFLGSSGRMLYVTKAKKIIAQIRKGTFSEEDAKESIEAAGGVSIAGAVLGLLLLIGFIGLAVIARLAKH
ncbi:MAG: hypothetical protein JO068_23090 [Hyphomicrobiales bacterium]|nr:hypothetical protein [Hyphomicrobiales bacterium]